MEKLSRLIKVDDENDLIHNYVSYGKTRIQMFVIGKFGAVDFSYNIGFGPEKCNPENDMAEERLSYHNLTTDKPKEMPFTIGCKYTESGGCYYTEGNKNDAKKILEILDESGLKNAWSFLEDKYKEQIEHG